MATFGLIILILIILIPLLTAAYIFVSRARATRAGLPPPPLASFNPFTRPRSPSSYSPSNALAWARTKFSALKNKRTAGGAYEGTSSSGGNNGRGFGPLDPDEAWDSRVGNEGDGYGGGGVYEEQELGLRSASAGRGGDALHDYGEEEMGRGRSAGREGPGYNGGISKVSNERYDEDVGGRVNPFGDEAERSDLRGVSPRPVEERKGKLDDSPSERRSMFHENM